MPKYVIEREMPDAGKMSTEDFHLAAKVSCDVIRSMGPEVQWLHSYVSDDKIYCVYIAPNAEMVKEHAVKGGFPADKIAEVTRMIDPTNAE